MPKGIVVSFERNSGFGFIETETEKKIFVHHSAIADADRKYLVAGQRVEFSLVNSELQGLRAEAVNVLHDVPLKAQRKLDWRHRRGSQPRPGERPRPRRSKVEDAEDADAEEGVLHATHVANRTPGADRAKSGESG
jgi:cold shock CspA family protein